MSVIVFAAESRLRCMSSCRGVCCRGSVSSSLMMMMMSGYIPWAAVVDEAGYMILVIVIGRR